MQIVDWQQKAALETETPECSDTTDHVDSMGEVVVQSIEFQSIEVLTDETPGSDVKESGTPEWKTVGGKGRQIPRAPHNLRHKREHRSATAPGGDVRSNVFNSERSFKNVVRGLARRTQGVPCA